MSGPTFPTAIPSTDAYLVTILLQPAGQVCTVANGDLHGTCCSWILTANDPVCAGQAASNSDWVFPPHEKAEPPKQPEHP